MADDRIIELEDGFRQVRDEGIKPFIDLVETEKREFFKAKEFVNLYDLIFKMCIQRDPYNWSEEMYNRYTRAITQYLTETVLDSLNQARQQHETAFLKEWVRRWAHENRIVKGLSKLFMYLDRFYTPNTDGVHPLKEQGFRLYNDFVFGPHCDHAAECILNAIQRERANEEQDRALLRESVQVFVELGFNLPDTKLKIYEEKLQQRLVEHAGAFYRRESQRWMEQDSCPSYLLKAESYLNHERERVQRFLNQASMGPLISRCHDELLKTHQQALLSKSTGVEHLLEANMTEDLSRLYRLYSKYPEQLEPIGESVQKHIAKVGASVVDKAQANERKTEAKRSEAIEDHSLVRRLIDLHHQYNTVVKDCFGNNKVFQKALKLAFESFINADNRVSKLLAKYVNDVLKKGAKISAKDVESTLDNVVFLYGYITEKDVFERDYQVFLASRLLMGSCESEHLEQHMIGKLKNECGYQWTNKLEGMFRDVQVSKELMAKFKRHFDTEKALGISLEVNVCTTGFWPSSKIVPCNMPKELVPVCDKYKQYYLNSRSGHKLDWRMDSGRAEVQVIFNKQTTRRLVVSSYQMMILLCFNENLKMTFEQIMQITGIPQYEISNHLLSLAHPKIAVLLKKPNNRELAPNHMFMINPKFSSKLIKVTVPLLSAAPTNKDKHKEDEAIALQRRHQMDAAIVRIMKIRKELKHSRLTAEVIQQLSARFKPKPSDIKKRIEALIDLEYLKRADNDRGLYQYQA